MKNEIYLPAARDGGFLPTANNGPAFVVGLGASAGGLEALERFFDNAPTDSNGAFVVVMHLARDFKSVLDELLARHTSMPIYPVLEGGRLCANTIYVIQPGTEIEVVGECFRVMTRSQPTASPRLSSVDILLQSLASAWGERAAAVILSGSGTDGAQGVIAVHGAGGVVFAQSPETAKFDSMPIAAIMTNCVSAVDTPETLSQLVAESIFLPRVSIDARKPSNQAYALQTILASVVGVSHLDASQYTQSTFERRVQRRMRELQINSLDAYSALVSGNRNEARTLSETLLIGVTDFFRDEKVFSTLARLVAPELIRRAHSERRPVRVWTPGCASGEEAYSIAMILAEAAADFPEPVEFQIFATDVHQGFLAEAARGEYSNERLQNVSAERRKAFFSRNSSGAWQIDASIRKNIVFAPQDVLVDPPFTRLDLVSCRNLLIYFSIEAQQRVIGSFAFGLLEKGFLVLGGSETVGAQRDSFEFVDVRQRIFRRTRSQSRSPSFMRALEPYERLGASSYIPSTRRSIKLRETFLQPVYAAILRDFAPPSLLVSNDRELLHTFGDARRFLRAPEGVVRLDITDMCDNALKTPLAAGIDRVIRDKTELTFSRLALQSFPEKGMIVDLIIKPIIVDVDSIFALVMINELNTALNSFSAPADNRDSLVSATQDFPRDRTEDLEIEILRTREALQATIEEIETANEQLKASNEELMSSNEELQSTNEELSSLNEELHSVNAEHFRQNNELLRLTRDFDALLHATEIGVIFFDESLNIRRFTRLIVDLFKFTESDVGRPIHTFRSPFVELNMESFLYRVMKSGSTEEIEAHDVNHRVWLLRAATYPDQKGVVLSIISIGKWRYHEVYSHAHDRVFANAAPYAGDALIIVSPVTGLIEFSNAKAFLRFGAPENQEENFEFSRLTPEIGTASWISWLSTIGVGGNASRLDVQFIDRDGNIFPVDIQATILQDNEKSLALIRISENQTRALAVRELQERARTFAISNRELEQFATVVAHDLRAPLRHLNQFAKFLLMELGANASSAVQEYLQIIQVSATDMSRMIERLLDYARIGSGAGKFDIVDLQDCVKQAISVLRDEAEAAHLEINYENLPRVEGDPILIARLFQNLASNALKYNRSGNVPRITIATRREGGMTVISFTDNGIGVDPRHSDEIFKMFSRLHSNANSTGHGMGLAICKRICEIHGGGIELDQTFRDGARFIIKLPNNRQKSLERIPKKL